MSPFPNRWHDPSRAREQAVLRLRSLTVAARPKNGSLTGAARPKNRSLTVAARKGHWAVVGVVVFGLAAVAEAQVGKSLGLLDINTAAEKDLAALPHMNAELAKSLVAARPVDGPAALNKHLLEHKLTQEQAAELYGKAFVHINLNTATKEEIMLIPGAGKKMAREFAEYRPWKTWAQFDREIGKYVGEKETARLAQYCFIPMSVKTATDEQLGTIPSLPPAALEAIHQSKSAKTVDELKAALAKATSEKEAGRIVRFLVVE
ncbi:Helix-hairpin-helix motif protein [Phycisphaerae bacterium RAS1]|nr:Helix-hairpin-helix motif protein [Phycisphaerae bacterium RAS1]